MCSMRNTRLSRRSLIAAIGGAGAARGLSAQTPEATPGARIRIPKLRIGVGSSPEIVPPTSATGMDAMWLSSLMYDAPLRWNEDGDVIPGVFAATTTSHTPELNLRPRANAMFSDGSPVTGRHAAESLIAIRNSRHGWRLQSVSGIDGLMDSTLQVTLDRADAALIANLCHPLFGLEAAGNGTGPFVPTSSSSDATTYSRNSLFWQSTRPHIDKLEVVHIPDDTQRSTAMATGEIDVLPNVPLLDVPMLENEPTVYLIGGPTNRLCHLQLRLSEPVLANRRVRQILSGAIDRAGLVSVATADQAEPTSTLFPGDEWTEDVEEVDEITSDEVREELQALGVPSDLRLHLLADNADATLANTAVVLQEQLAECGISLSITLLEQGELETAMEVGGYDLLVSYSEPWRDPHELVWPLLSSLGPLNWSGYDSVEVDTLLRAANTVSDPEFRKGRYTRLEGLIQRDVPCIPLFRPYAWDAVHVDYPGYQQLPPTTSRGLMTLLPTDGA